MARADGILLCGGGTGGHVFPGLAVAAELEARGHRPLRWIGDPQRIEAELVPRAGIELLPVGLGRPRPRSPCWLLGAAWRALVCWRELGRRPPRAVIALGGYAALLPGLIAPWRRRPLVVLEQNARPGRTNRLLARFADAVVTQFPEAARSLPRRRVHCLGNPIRPLAVDERGRGRRLRLLVMGGSLAARSLNDLLIAAAPRLAEIADLELVHLAGEAERERVAAAYRDAGLAAEVLGFCRDMPALYRRVDLMLGRAGATTVAECCAAGLGALYLPLPWAADDHQSANARAVARVGGAVVLPQRAVGAAGIARVVARLAAERALVTRLGARARILARPQAAADVVDLVERVARLPRPLPPSAAAEAAELGRAA